MKLKDLIKLEDAGQTYSSRPGGHLWQLQGDPRELPSYKPGPTANIPQHVAATNQLQQTPAPAGTSVYPVQYDPNLGTHIPNVPDNLAQQITQPTGPTGTQIVNPNAGVGPSLTQLQLSRQHAATAPMTPQQFSTAFQTPSNMQATNDPEAMKQFYISNPTPTQQPAQVHPFNPYDTVPNGRRRQQQAVNSGFKPTLIGLIKEEIKKNR